ncbi:MAG TPA: hypothetical protein PKB14_17310 [Rubrivivax sp.]|nr:hypothetical protein [Rubrivivax sp.]
MTRQIAEWLWRAAMVCALAWIGWELHQMRLELGPPEDDQATAEASAPDDLQAGIGELGEQVAALHEKIDAIMIAMTQLRRYRESSPRRAHG